MSNLSFNICQRIPTLDSTMPLMLLPKIEAHVNALVTPPPPPPAISTTPTKTSPISTMPNEDITFSVNHGLNQVKVKKRKLSSDLGVSGKFNLTNTQTRTC